MYSKQSKILFKNPDHQAVFEQQGFLKLDKSILDLNEITKLTHFLNTSGILQQTNEPVFIAMDHPKKPLVNSMIKMISEALSGKLDNFIIDPSFFYGSFIIKYPNNNLVVKPHQDGTFIDDELSNNSFTCWIPLVDVDINNGCIGLIKGSNKILTNIRPLPSPYVYRPLDKFAASLLPYFELIPMKAGECLIFDNKTFHISPPNLSNKIRPAISMWFTQKNAQLIHYYLKPSTTDKVLKYKIDTQFFIKYDNQKLARMYENGNLIEDYELIGEEDYVPKDFTEDEMLKEVEQLGNTNNLDFSNYMNNLIPKYENKNMFKKITLLISKIFHTD